MSPFKQKLTWTLLAIGCYVLPYGAAELGLEKLAALDALLFPLAGVMIGKEWAERSQDRAARKARESVAPPKGAA